MNLPLTRFLVALAVLSLGLLPAMPEITVTPIEAKAEDGGGLLRVRVVDAGSGEPIAKFRVISGVEIAIRAEKEFSDRHPGEEIVNWQPHTTQLGENGLWERPLAKAYDPLALRVEAEGYVPQRHLWLDKKLGSQEVSLRLVKDPGVKGRVTLPDGKPAAGATIGIALVQRNLRIEGHRFLGFGEPEAEKPGDRWRRPTMVVADAKGIFTLPTEIDPASAVVAVHPDGMAQMFYADFAATPKIRLSDWGSIAGTVTAGEAPGEGVEVTFSIQHYGYGYPDMVAQGATVKTDPAGKFRFEGVAPGLVQVSLFDYFPKNDDRGFGGFLHPPASAFTHLTVKPGETAEVSLGGPELAPLPAVP